MVGWTESCATTGLRERDEQLRNQNSQAVHCGNITTEGNRGNEGREKPLSHSLRYLRYLLCDPHPVLPLAVAAKRDGRGWRPTPIDAVVADAYGLSRDHYAHVLSTFSHASYKKAPELCLARFDELKSIGLDAFTKKHDPYWDIPLNESLPQPVIDLPGLGEGGEEERFELGETAGKRKRKGRARK